MFLQRLLADDTIGFRYDFMGSAEYENGATRTGRLEIAKAYLAGTIEARAITFIEVHGKSVGEPVEVMALGRTEFLDKLGKIAEIRTTKEAFRTREEGIIGWMNVGWDACEPLLLLRADGYKLQERLDKFMADPIKALQAGDA